MMNPTNNEEGSKRVFLKKIPLYDMLKLLEHLYETGADFVDIVGISMGEGIQDEIMIAVKEEYMSRTQREEEEEMEGTANIIDRNEEEDDEVFGPEGKRPARITEQDINDLLGYYGN